MLCCLAAMISSPDMLALQVVGRRFLCRCNSYSPLKAECLYCLCHACFLCAIWVDMCAESDCSGQSHAIQGVLSCTIAHMPDSRCNEQHTITCTQCKTHKEVGSPL